MKGINSISTIAIAAVFCISLNFLNTDAIMTVEQIKNMMKPLGKTCVSKVGLSPELQEAHRNGQFPEEKSFMCYIHCLARMTKVFDKNNQIDLEGTFKQAKLVLPEDLIDGSINAYKTCYPSATSEEPCEKAYQFGKCYYETDAKSYFYP
ncbi:general odorant-binding protein 83a-like [Microplitis demolitor]|uniref:general odorant-binding protein 83a-like n=1 Tax=Microplitis demolitor TaxID=69319 RepID=UPI00235B66D4|nr:general odorant-binding protein 83a-like [Microplitis demolitor]